MIKPQELRIGNLVFDDNNDICKICYLSSSKRIDYEDIDINEFQVEYNDKPYIYLSSVVNPIIISEERLIELDLIKSANGCYMLGCCELSLNPISEDWDTYIKGDVLTSIKYIHQLQNLYFALAGEELTL